MATACRSHSGKCRRLLNLGTAQHQTQGLTAGSPATGTISHDRIFADGFE
jgi:hypothetical protein